MSEEISRFEEWFRICLLIAAVSTTLFVVLWAMSPWHHTLVGRLIMLRSVAIAVVLDLTAYYLFWANYSEFRDTYYLLATVTFGIITVASIGLTYTMIRTNYFHRKKEKQDE